MKYCFILLLFILPTLQIRAQDTIKQKTEWKPVQTMPAFPGGDKALFKYITKNQRYPTEAREKNIQGTVIVKFIIDENGNVNNVEAVKEVPGGCTEEALRVVKGMPKWKPGIQDGKPVKVEYHLPITFRLGD